MLVVHRPFSNHALRKTYKSSGARTPSPSITIKMSPIRTHSPIKLERNPILVLSPMASDRVWSPIQKRIRNPNRSNQPIPIIFPIEDNSDEMSNIITLSNHHGGNLERRKAMLQRVLLRPHSLHNYEKEKSLEIIKKGNAVTPNMVPHCFRNYRQGMHKPTKSMLSSLMGRLKKQ